MAKLPEILVEPNLGFFNHPISSRNIDPLKCMKNKGTPLSPLCNMAGTPIAPLRTRRSDRVCLVSRTLGAPARIRLMAEVAFEAGPFGPAVTVIQPYQRVGTMYLPFFTPSRMALVVV